MLQHHFTDGLGGSSLVQSKHNRLQAWRLHNCFACEMFPLHACRTFPAATCDYRLVLSLRTSDKPLFVELFNFGSSAL